MAVTKGRTEAREDVLAHLVAEYEVMLLRTCYMYFHDQALAEDATQETFLKAYKALHSFRGESSEKTWLMRIAINTCRDMKRHAWFRCIDRSVEVERLMLPDQAPEFGVADELAQAILKLPVKYKEVVLLHFYQDMTMREVAGVLGIPASTVQKRVKTACRKLKELLEKEDLDEA